MYHQTQSQFEPTNILSSTKESITRGKNPNGWYYMLWTVGVPLAAIFLGVATLNTIPGASILVCIAALPLAFNILFGPSVFAFWHHKKSRTSILIVNFAVFFLSFAAGRPGIPGLLIWIWAFKGKTD